MALLSKPDGAALGALARAAGWWTAARVAAAIVLRRAGGEPFADLPPAATAAESGSRGQAGGAILLYRALRGRVDDPLGVAGAAIEAAALAFLGEAIGPLSGAFGPAAGPAAAGPRDGGDPRGGGAESADDAARRAFVADRLARFPNVDARIDEITPERVAFTVTRCRLVELARLAGHPELAPLFCAADARYFGEVQRGVRLDRPSTIASGRPTCAFVLTTVAEAEPPEPSEAAPAPRSPAAPREIR
jgi:hypothetical protein